MGNVSEQQTGKQHYTITSTIRLKPHPSYAISSISMESALTTARRQVRLESPKLACTTDAFKLTCSLPDETALESWISKTFEVSPASSATELYPNLPCIHQATVYWIPESSQLMFRYPHWNIATGL